jgi:hypothetical protein
MNPFVLNVLAVARPVFLDAVCALRDVTPVIERADAEVRLTMHGRQRNGRNVGIRVYQLEAITRLITTHLEGELPAAVADATRMEWFSAQIAKTAKTVASNLSIVADV